MQARQSAWHCLFLILKFQKERSESERMNKIAIIGMGCLFPDYSDKEKFWNTIINGGTLLCKDKFLDRPLERGGICFSGTEFFADYFSAGELKELEQYGELYKWCAYIVDEALKDAGYANNESRLERTGLIVGSVGQTTRDQIDFFGSFITRNLEKEINEVTGGDRFKYTFTPQIENLKPESMLAVSEPVSYLARKRGIGGPALSFNAACASPLYALRMAMSYLNEGSIDMAIAGSQCYNETIGGIFGLFNKFGILCDMGQSMPLDEKSKGLIPGSGAGVFVLKRLADAEADGDNILAVIEGLGWSNDGGTSSGIMTPSAIGQVKALELAYADGASREIDYIECHATGTVAGDQTEIESIERFFGYDYITGEDNVIGRPMLGGLKASTGHFFTATACASIVKVIMAMQHEVIPATIRVEDPLCKGLVLENTAWKAGEKPRRAGVNAFGFGGINAHLVLSEYCPQIKAAPEVAAKKTDYGKTELAVTGMGLKIGDYKTVDEFLQGLLGAGSAFNEPDENRFRGHDRDRDHVLSHGFEDLPKGSYINSFRFDAMRFKMPLVGDPFFLRRDMLLLETAAEALDSAGIKKGEAPRTAVIVHSASDFTDTIFMATYEIDESLRSSLKESLPELTQEQRDEILNIMRGDEAQRERVDNVPGMITNIRGNRISAHWEFFGPSLTVFETETSVFRCLELARFFIAEKIVDQVVIGVSSFSGEFEHLFVQKELGAMDIMLEHGVAEGAVVLVVKSKEDAVKNKDNIYSVISGVALSGVSKNTKPEVETTLEKVFAQAKVGKGAISAIEIPDSYSTDSRGLILDICKNTYGKYFNEQPVISDIERYLGYGFSLSAAASIVRHCLQQHLGLMFTKDPGKPPSQNWQKFENRHTSLVTGYNREGYFGCVVMTSHHDDKAGKKIRQRPSGLVPMPIPFNTETELIEGISEIKAEADSKKMTLGQIFDGAWKKYDAAVDGREGIRAVVILCDSKNTLKDELDILNQQIESDRLFLKASESIETANFEIFIEEESTEDDVIEISELFGLTSEQVRSLRLGRTIADFRPADYLLRLGAKLLFEGIRFDYKKFFGNFDFGILNRPSFICEVSTGMPDFCSRVDTEENRLKLAPIKAQISRRSENSIPSAAIPGFKRTPRSARIGLNDFYRRHAASAVRMVDEILTMDESGGRYGLGKIEAMLEPECGHSIFVTESHQTMLSKQLLSEGLNQLQALHCMQLLSSGESRAEWSEGIWTSYAPVIPSESILRYEMHVSSISEDLEKTTVMCDADIFLDDLCVCEVIQKSFVVRKRG